MSWLRRNLRFLFFAFFCVLIFFALGVYQRYYLPKIKSWALLRIYKTTSRMGPILVAAKTIDFHLLPVGASLHDVDIKPKGELARQLVPTKVQRVDAFISFWSFLAGRLELSTVDLVGLDVKVFVRRSKDAKKPKGFNFEFLNQVPIRRVSIQDATLWFSDENSQIAAQAPEFDLVLSKHRLAVVAEVDAKSFRVKRTGDKAIFDSDVSFRTRVSQQEIVLNRLKVKKEDSFVLASGTLFWDSTKLTFDRVEGKTRSLIQMRDVEYLSREFFPSRNIPQMQGRLFLELATDHIFGKDLSGTVRMRSRSLAVNEFQVGDIKAEGRLDESGAKFSNFQVQHRGGKLKFSDLVTQIKPPYKVSARVTGQDVDIHSLLDGLKVKNIPVHTRLQPNMDCQGRLAQPYQVSCKGEISVAALAVRTRAEPKKTQKEIVSVKNGKVSGQVEVSPKNLLYIADVELPNSKGRSAGRFQFGKSYQIQFTAERVDLGAVENIGPLRVGGFGAVTGEVRGVKGQPTVTEFEMDGSQLRLQGWQLGDAKAKVSINNGILAVNGIEGRLENSIYKGQVSYNFRERLLSIDTRVPQLDLSYVSNVFPEKFRIPKMESAGMGQGYFRLFGPPNLREADWSAQLQTQRGVLSKESFDRISLRLQSQKGKITTQECLVRKGTGQLTCRLSGDPKSGYNANLAGRNLSIEQSESIQQTVESASGQMNFDFDLKDIARSLEVSGSGKLSNVRLGDLPIAPTSFTTTYKENDLRGSLKLGEDIAILNYQMDTRGDQPFVASGQFNNWDFSQIFSAFSDSMRVNTYQANLRAQFEFNGKLRNPKSISGQFEIENLALRSNDIKIENNTKMYIKVANGSIRAEDFFLQGGDNFVRLKNSEAKTPVALASEGKLELSLLSLLTPFFDDLKGNLNFALDLRGTLNDLRLSGSTFVKNGFLRAKTFPHPLEQFSVDLLFDNNKVVLNSLKGRLAGGTIGASGSVIFRGYKDVPVSIRGQFFDTSLEVPSGFQTRGSGTVEITGDWQPYTLKASYNIVDGKVDKEMKGKSNDKVNVTPSPYLPELVTARRISPVILDVDVRLPDRFPVNLRVARLDIRSHVSGNMTVQGYPSRPQLKGRINVARGSEVYFRDNRFEVESGSVIYRSTTPENPELNVTAHSRVLAKIGPTEERDVDIYLRVLGTAKEPEVNVSSQPALAEKDLISLLAFGFIPQAENTAQNGDLSSASAQIGTAIINDLLGLNRQIGRRLGVEFDISSGTDSEDSSSTQTSFTVRKQWTPNFGTSASRSVGKTNKNNVRAEYKINRNLSVIGSYEGKEQTGAAEVEEEADAQNQFGVDLEYRVDFK